MSARQNFDFAARIWLRPAVAYWRKGFCTRMFYPLSDHVLRAGWRNSMVSVVTQPRRVQLWIRSVWSGLSMEDDRRLMIDCRSEGVSVVCLRQDMNKWLVLKQGWCRSGRVLGLSGAGRIRDPTRRRGIASQAIREQAASFAIKLLTSITSTELYM